MHRLKPFWIWISIRRENRPCNRRKLALVNPHFLCVKVIGIVDNLPMYVFSIDIPFKGSQSLAKMMSKVTAVSYLHSGVTDSAVHVTVVSMTSLCMSQRCQWLRCDMHSGVNDCTEMFSKFNYLHSGVIDTAVHVTVVSWHRCVYHSSVNDSAVQVTAGSMTPLCKSQRSPNLRTPNPGFNPGLNPPFI
jgi:hypothetical protein